MKLADWSQYTDNVLLMSITRNANNYDLASVEVTKAAIKKALSDKVKLSNELLNVDELSKSFTADMCRARWSYVQLMRKMGKKIEYDAKARYKKASPKKVKKQN